MSSYRCCKHPQHPHKSIYLPRSCAVGYACSAIQRSRSYLLCTSVNLAGSSPRGQWLTQIHAGGMLAQARSRLLQSCSRVRVAYQASDLKDRQSITYAVGEATNIQWFEGAVPRYGIRFGIFLNIFHIVQAVNCVTALQLVPVCLCNLLFEVSGATVCFIQVTLHATLANAGLQRKSN